MAKGNHTGIDLDALEATASLGHLRAPSVGRWRVGDEGWLYKAQKTTHCDEELGEGDKLMFVTSTPPVVVCDLADEQTGHIRALVAFNVAGRRVEVALDRDVLLSNTRVVAALAPLGANVSTTNARDVVSYLTDCDAAFGHERRKVSSTSRMGWTDGMAALVPYETFGAGPYFDPGPDAVGLARRFQKPAGTLSAWSEVVGSARRESIALRALVAASLASVLVGPVGAQPFVTYLWGRSRSGKTAALKAAASVWGDPREGTDAYVGTFADTKKSIVRKASMLGDFPIVIDELQSSGAAGQAAKRSDVEALVYELTLGHERSALRADRSMMASGSWSSVTIATGEVPITGDSTQQGALNRVIELCAEPFNDPSDAQKLHWLVGENYGTAGREFAAYAREVGAERLRETYREMVLDVSRACPDCPQAQSLALVTLADAMAECCVFGDADVTWAGARASAVGFAHELSRMLPNARERDTDGKAIEYVAELLAANEAHFEEDTGKLERFGKREVSYGRTTWVVFGSWLAGELERAGFDATKALQRMREEGMIGGSGRSLRTQRRIGGTRVYCVVIDGTALDAFIGE